ncbi:M23 family metallopeptidase [Streptomyces sp. NPDC052101]|uniref:M23 family metallopeptidase n=1 Tax=Streptomyces sp. NPDC052101 TaxID=3155763 RepID=UPI00343C51E8
MHNLNADHHTRAVARAVEELLNVSADQRARQAPHLISEVGAARLERIIAATRTRIGTEQAEVTYTYRRGMTINGPKGRVAAWGSLDGEGRLAGLLIDGSSVPRWWPSGIPIRLVWATAAFGMWVYSMVDLSIADATAPTMLTWLSYAVSALLGCLLLIGFSAPKGFPRWVRLFPYIVLGTVAAAFVWLLVFRGVPVGHGGLDQVGYSHIALLVAALAFLVRGRGHRWGQPVSTPLRFPLTGPGWYITQGGGRFLNHHRTVAAQRGAIDLVKTGPNGTNTGRFRFLVPSRDLNSYHAYGQPVLAPCSGSVVTAVDGVADQPAGRVHYGPLYGNHVVIDTGHEHVVLAHLRPGTVSVTAGDVVRVGQLLGEVGNSGRSTEPHLHIHAERDGTGLDLQFIGVTGGLYRGRTIPAP